MYLYLAQGMDCREMGPLVSHAHTGTGNQAEMSDGVLPTGLWPHFMVGCPSVVYLSRHWFCHLQTK